MDYFRYSTHLDGPAAGGLISLLLIASIISQPMVISARSQVNVMPYASGRAGPFETCVNVTSGEEGRCMFAMDCFRARGRHVGICTKGFYFGSCCTLPTYSSSTTDPPLIIRPPSAASSSPAKEPLPLTADNLPRVPIGVLESNDIDGPEAGRPPFDPLDLSYWPDLLADIYALKPQPITLSKFPYSTFHAPSISSSSSSSHGNAASSSTVSPVVVSPGSIGPAAVNATTTSSSIPPTTTPSSTVMTTVTTATTTTTTTTLKTPSSSSPSTTTTSVPTTTTTTTTSSSTSSSAVTEMSPLSSSGTWTTTWTGIGSTKPNVTVIYANAVVESQTPGVVPIQESWLEEEEVVDQPTTSIPPTSSTSTTTTTAKPTALSTTRTSSTSVPSSPTTTTTTTPTSSSSLPVAIKDERNVTFTLLPSLAPAPDLQRLAGAVCGKPVYRWPKIVSGENARLGQWPWQVTLQEKTRRGYFHKCGASLLSKDWVITAAHCLSNVQPESLLVRMGGIDFASVEDKWIESRVQPVQHPQFNIHTQANDIALLKLLTPLVAYQSSTLPICLPDKDMEFDGDQSFVSGWGRLGEKSPISTRLQYVGVPIINNTECQKIYQSIHKKIDRQSICAGYPEGLKDSCEGDSGGPMMVYKRGRWVLAGIISWGVGCARPNQPGVSTRVTEFLDWIQSTLDGDSLPAT
ncbi:serine proteinase stubble-like isoform X1 [Daphnia pulex]|uniref:serine proteinase stubble-like isoform X1 n=1 Tax=Daphnia pulex TaxID=6669 RepID=UPI001EE0D6FA|nr:serine proteinase stubble-like isoform X1 [Daphnia pulex]